MLTAYLAAASLIATPLFVGYLRSTHVVQRGGEGEGIAGFAKESSLEGIGGFAVDNVAKKLGGFEKGRGEGEFVRFRREQVRKGIRKFRKEHLGEERGKVGKEQVEEGYVGEGTRDGSDYFTYFLPVAVYR